MFPTGHERTLETYTKFFPLLSEYQDFHIIDVYQILNVFWMIVSYQHGFMHMKIFYAFSLVISSYSVTVTPSDKSVV